MPQKLKSSRSNETSAPDFKRIIPGSLFGTFLFFVLIVLFSVTALKTDFLSSAAYMPLGIFSGAMSSFSGGFISVRPTRKKGALLGILSGLFQAFLITAILLFIYADNPGSGLFIFMAVITVFGLLGGISAVNLKMKKKYK